MPAQEDFPANPPRILIAGGGTGGHIIPALAVARELQSRHKAEVLFVGTSRGMESRLVPDAGFQLELIEVGPLNRVSLAQRLRTLGQLPLSLESCFRILRQFRPNAVFGVGGYASGPAMVAAILSRIPTMAFEPNAVPGLANRLIGKRVQAAAVNFPPAARWFRHAEVTGIPVRPEFFSLPAPPPGSAPHLLVFGGSQGAQLFNRRVSLIAAALFHAVPRLTILHQSGARHAESTRAAYKATRADPSRWQVEPFLDNMAERFAAATLILARSGASTVADTAASGKPALLVPFAAAADDHQRSNALVMVRAGAAAMLQERQFAEPEILLETLRSLLLDPPRLEAMAEAARAQARPGAAERIAARLISLVHPDPDPDE